MSHTGESIVTMVNFYILYSLPQSKEGEREIVKGQFQYLKARMREIPNAFFSGPDIDKLIFRAINTYWFLAL